MIQCPLNLYESDAVLGAADGRAPLLETAQEKGVAVMVNRPLNALKGTQLMRLAEYTLKDEPKTDQEVQVLLGEFEEVETHLVHLLEDEGSVESLLVHINLNERIRTLWTQEMSFAQWKTILIEYLLPHIEILVSGLAEKLEMTKDRGEHIESYIRHFNHLIHVISEWLKEQSNHRAMTIKDQLRQVDDEIDPRLKLSQLAVQVLRSTPGVGVTLVGMRESHYVTDISAAISLERLPEWDLSKWSEIKAYLAG